ncbi:hypothetical protein FHS55_004654 [Angulomicrobium tetraedrale]|uniref:HTH lysR-type domain-containing protein n=1 Tax=Ancylobacter tetraedralis TaxID=217068 RepID=A0A839ZGU3_9HYPH|nr:LysR family transcriptional regulator [Ancylobacter tetraedralis]MBB3774004.1 hypothetical protein [Ancylobacter tetraedralis]
MKAQRDIAAIAQRLDPFLLKHWRFILAAAEEGSFRRAADRLGVQQSTLSRRIRDIEDAMGATLFARSHAGVRPTFAGVVCWGPRGKSWPRHHRPHWRWSAPEPHRMAPFASVYPRSHRAPASRSCFIASCRSVRTSVSNSSTRIRRRNVRRLGGMNLMS